MKKLVLSLLLALAYTAAWAQKPPINGVAGPTTSSQFEGIITDPTGTGQAMFNVNPLVSYTPGTPSITSSAITLNLGVARFFNANNTANVNTVSITNVPINASGFALQITGTGQPWRWVWPSNVHWAEGTSPPYIPFVPGYIIVLDFKTTDGGTNWFAKVNFRGDGRFLDNSIESFTFFVGSPVGSTVPASNTNTCRSYATPCASFAGLTSKFTLQPGDRVCIENGSVFRPAAATNGITISSLSGAVNSPIVIAGCGPSATPWAIYNSQQIASGAWSSTVGTVYQLATAIAFPSGGVPCITWVDAAAGNAKTALCTGVRGTSSVVTFTSGTPGFVNWSGHGMHQGNAITFTGGTPPPEITLGTTYYLINSASSPTVKFEIAATENGTPINFSTSGSGTTTASSELGIDQYVVTGGNIFVNLGTHGSPVITDQIEVGNSSYGIQVEGSSNWRIANGIVFYSGNNNVVLDVTTPATNITFEDMQFGYTSIDNINCENGGCDGLVLRGIYSHHAWNNITGGSGDCASIHDGTMTATLEYSTMAWCGKDGFDMGANVTATIRFNFFDHSNAGTAFGNGGMGSSVTSGVTTSTGAFNHYGNIYSGDGSAYNWGSAQYAIAILGPFTADTFTLNSFCNVYYVPSIVNSNFRAITIQAGQNSGGGAFENNITSGPWGIGLYMPLGLAATTATVDYNIVYNTGNNYNGLTQPAHDLTTDPLFTSPTTGDFTLQGGSPALASGNVIVGRTVTPTPNRGRYGCSL